MEDLTIVLLGFVTGFLIIFIMRGGKVENVITAITGMATTVQTNALTVIANILPVLAVVIAAVIVAMLGVRLVKRFSK